MDEAKAKRAFGALSSRIDDLLSLLELLMNLNLLQHKKIQDLKAKIDKIFEVRLN